MWIEESRNECEKFQANPWHKRGTIRHSWMDRSDWTISRIKIQTQLMVNCSNKQ